MQPEKSQDIRLLDVFVIGPFLLYLSMHPEQEPEWLKPWIFLLGVGTIAYNAATYLNANQ
jgi:hypothetical protein